MKKKGIIIGAIFVIAAVAGFAGYRFMDHTLFQYGDSKVSYEEGAVYAKVHQLNAEKEYGSSLGEQMWSMKVNDNTTLEESIKRNAIEQIKAVKVLCAHAADEKVSLTADEKKKAKEKADIFTESDEGKAIMEATGADASLINKMYEENALATKVKQTITDGVDQNVSLEEAKVKTVYKLVFATTKKDKDGKETKLPAAEIAKQKQKAQKAYKALKKGADMSFLAKQYNVKDNAEESYSKGQSAGGEKFEQAVAKLKKGQFTGVIEDNQGYVVAKLISDYDKSKTEKNKSDILEKRRAEAFQKKYSEWTKDLDKDWDDNKSIRKKYWDKITFTYGELNQK